MVCDYPAHGTAPRTILRCHVALYIFILFTIWSPASAAQADEPITADGSVGLDFKVKNYRNGSMGYLLDLDLETRRRNDVKAVLKFESGPTDLAVRTESAHFNVQLSETLGWDAGYLSKDFGQEFAQGRSKRIFFKRPQSSDTIEAIGISGRTPGIRFQYQGDDNDLSLMLGAASSSDTYLLSHIKSKFEPIRLENWLLLQADSIDNGYQVLFAIDQSLAWKTDTTRIEVEASYGVDPVASEYSTKFGDGSRQFFASVQMRSLFAIFGSWDAALGLVESMENVKVAESKVLESRIGVRHTASNSITSGLEFADLWAPTDTGKGLLTRTKAVSHAYIYYNF